MKLKVKEYLRKSLRIEQEVEYGKGNEWII